VSDAVNLASRLEGLTKVFGAAIVTSAETLSRVEKPENYNVRYVGGISIKGRDETARVYEVFDGDPPDVFDLKSSSKPAFEEGVRLFDAAEFEGAIERFDAVLGQNPSDRAAVHYREKAGHMAMRKSPRT
jgi:hypothetical protein